MRKIAKISSLGFFLFSWIFSFFHTFCMNKEKYHFLEINFYTFMNHCCKSTRFEFIYVAFCPVKNDDIVVKDNYWNMEFIIAYSYSLWGVIQNPRGLIFGDFLPLLPLWSQLLNKAYVIKWPFGWLPSPSNVHVVYGWSLTWA